MSHTVYRVGQPRGGDFSAMANGQIKVVGTTDNGTRIGCMKKFDAVLLSFLMVIVAVLVRAEDTKEVVIASDRELKGVKAKKTFNRLGDPIVKAVEVKGPNPVPFYMDATEVTVGQFKKFVEESGY